MVCKDNVRPAISMRDKLMKHSFDYGRISHPPSTYLQEAQKFEQRLPAARRFIVERGLNEVIEGDEKELGIILQGGLTYRPPRPRALGRADVSPEPHPLSC
jgi:indolepyruvate ferredoxin oxidoreductase alpha subunit